jgi:tetratricopeptide (TPR) repeat protein
MIVKNEAATLGRCLKSVREFADQMLVFDTGSTDQTAAMATALGAQVYALDWTQDFAAARNASLAAATGDWILVIDADETLTTAGGDCLAALRAGEAIADIPHPDVLAVTWLRQELGSRQSPYSLVSRLFRNHSGLRFTRPYHETIDDSALALIATEPHWQIAQVNIVALHHTGYTPDAIATADKFQRARNIMATYLAQHPDDAYLCNKLGALYGQTGDWAAALPLLQRGLAQPQLDPVTRYELHYHAGMAYRQLNQLQPAEMHYRQALTSPLPEPLKIGAYLNLGSLLKQQEQLLEAIELFTTITQIDPTQALAYYNLGTAQRARGHLELAISAYQQAIALAPGYAEAHQNLAVALFKLGQLPESLEAFQKALQLYQQTDPGAALRLKQGMQQLGLVR